MSDSLILHPKVARQHLLDDGSVRVLANHLKMALIRSDLIRPGLSHQAETRLAVVCNEAVENIADAILNHPDAKTIARVNFPEKGDGDETTRA